MTVDPPRGGVTASAPPVAVPVPRDPTTAGTPSPRAEVAPAARSRVPVVTGAVRPDAADVVVGLLALTAAAAGSALARAIRVPEAVLTRLPVPHAVRRGWRTALRTAAARGSAERLVAADLLRGLTDRVVPWAAPLVLSRLDVAALVREFVDLDRIAGGLDVDAVVARVDVDAVLARLDLDAIAAKLDLDELVGRVDVDRVADRLDLDRVVDRVDLDRIAERIDVDRIAARLDLDPLIDRADLLGLARYVIEGIDLVALIRTSSETIGAEAVRGVRASSADADQAVERIVDRLLLRRRARRTELAARDDRPGGGRT
jgi:hypothetical protein